MAILNFGICQYEKREFDTPCFVEKGVNKINGGIWACPQNDYYTDWIAIAPFVAAFVSKNKKMCCSRIILKNDAKTLMLTIENYKDFSIENGTLSFEKLKDFDCIHFTKDLVENVKAFESYYVESYQILNLDCIAGVEFISLDLDYMKSEEYLVYAFKRTAEVMEHIMNTDIYKKFSNKPF